MAYPNPDPNPDPSPRPLHRLEARAELEFAVRRDKTRLVKSFAEPPLRVQRALYLDEAAPDLAFLYLLNSTPGLFQDDIQTIRVTAGPQSRTHLTTPSAVKVIGMPHREARQFLELDLQEGAYLEYLPEPLIPFRGSRLAQHNCARLAVGAILIAGEVLSPGRVARGESFAFEHLERRLTVNGPDGKPLLHEASLIAPQARTPLGLSTLNPQLPVSGSLTIMAPGQNFDGLRAKLEQLLGQYPTGCAEFAPRYKDGDGGAFRLQAAITALSRDGGLAIRTLAADAEDAVKILRKTLETARRHFLGPFS